MGLYFDRDQDFDALYRATAERNRIPMHVLKGITAAESSFNPRGVTWEPSHKSTRQPGDTDASYGLMQVTGRTARAMGLPATQDPATLFDPAVNLEYGARVVRSFLDNPYRNFSTGKAPADPAKVVQGQSRLADAIASFNMGYPRPIRQTTAGIAKIYDDLAPGYVAKWQEWRAAPPPGWVYANQPYVDRVLAFATLYKLAEEGNTAAVADVLAALKKKSMDAWRGAWFCLAPGWPSS
jgi:soluble lytic murein transglycosylase-like protein